MIYLSKRVEFSAAHRLYSSRLSPEENARLFGKCSRAPGHGHNYVLEVTLAGEPDPVTGMVVNLTDFKQLLERHVLSELDHQDLNGDLPMLRGRIPTAENLALSVWERLAGKLPAGRLHEVKVWETDANCASYRGEELP
jgi:6-pyruvoyltetrahydropterin/6-carboxytetrahydropterin synthase